MKLQRDSSPQENHSCSPEGTLLCQLRVEGWMAQRVMCLLCEHEELGLDYQQPNEKLGDMTRDCTVSSG